MDIYQLWVAYNPQWSRRESLCFLAIFVVTLLVVVHNFYIKRITMVQAVAILALVVFLGIVFGSTVFTRISTFRRYELIPFWSWRDIIRYHDQSLVIENLLNCILLLPAGALLPVIAGHKVKWYHALLFGGGVSAVIEVSQLVFMRGLFEWDDMIHNGLGCMVGCLLINIFMKKKRGKA